MSASLADEQGLPRWVTPVALLLLVIVGAVLRFLNLGELTYQVDEGYQLLGVKGILEHGVPKLESGHAYTRAPIFLYLEAWCAQLLGLSPFSMRLPAAVFGVLCIPIAWWFGRTLVNPAMGWALAALITFSQWHIELSRYARFYTLLVAVFMLAMIAFYHGYMLRKHWPKLAFWVLALIAITIHDTAVSLGLIFLVLLTYRDQTWTRRALLVVQSGVLGVFWIVYRKALGAWTASLSDANFDIVYTTNTEARDAASEASKKPLAFLPDVKLPELKNTVDAWGLNPLYILVPIGIGLLGLVIALATARKLSKRDAIGQLAVGVLMVLCAVMHQGALVVMLAVTAAAWWVRTRKDLWSPLGVSMFASAAMLGVHAAVNVKFLSYGYVRGVVWLFRYPDWSRYSLEHLWRGWLSVLIVLPIGLLMLTWRARNDKGRPAGPWLIVGLLLLGLCLGGLAEGQFNETRYFFHLSPMIYAAYAIVFVAVGLWFATVFRLAKWGRVVAVALPMMLGMGLVEDFRPNVAWSVTQRGYGDVRNHVRGVFNWRAFADFHEDLETTSLYVRDNLGPNDKVLSVGPPHRGTLVDHFVGKVDYIVARPLVFTLKRQDEEGRWYEPNNGAQIVDTPERLFEAIAEVEADGGRLWVISNDRMTGELANLVDPDYAAVLEQVTPRETHAVRGRDGSSFAAVALLILTKSEDSPPINAEMPKNLIEIEPDPSPTPDPELPSDPEREPASESVPEAEPSTEVEAEVLVDPATSAPASSVTLPATSKPELADEPEVDSVSAPDELPAGE